MRKVGSEAVMPHIEEKIALYSGWLEQAKERFMDQAASKGLEAALQGDDAMIVALNQEVVSELSRISESDVPVTAHLACLASAAVDQLRDDNTPRWKRLALAAILEVLVGCGGSEG